MAPPMVVTLMQHPKPSLMALTEQVSFCSSSCAWVCKLNRRGLEDLDQLLFESCQAVLLVSDWPGTKGLTTNVNFKTKRVI
jgi:hypothetical protein